MKKLQVPAIKDTLSSNQRNPVPANKNSIPRYKKLSARERFLMGKIINARVIHVDEPEENVESSPLIKTPGPAIKKFSAREGFYNRLRPRYKETLSVFRPPAGISEFHFQGLCCTDHPTAPHSLNFPPKVTHLLNIPRREHIC